MAVRLTHKKREELMKQIDDILLNHRLKIYQQLSPQLTHTNVDQIRSIISDMNEQLVREFIGHLNDLREVVKPVDDLFTPLSSSDNEE